jgi:hypothetical protein
MHDAFLTFHSMSKGPSVCLKGSVSSFDQTQNPSIYGRNVCLQIMIIARDFLSIGIEKRKGTLGFFFGSMRDRETEKGEDLTFS